ncbi:MAG TPA: hypothetical protein VHH73_10660, partial [Verrucomicrobiae bacterium]|nr:hypothetical protein [Verrucomicrobiae bacterium]
WRAARQDLNVARPNHLAGRKMGRARAPALPKTTRADRTITRQRLTTLFEFHRKQRGTDGECVTHSG